MPANSLPIVPLRGSVLFPGVALPISLVRENSRRAVPGALRDCDPRGLVLAHSRNGSDLARRLVDDLDSVLRAALRARRGARA